jgi:hypothetical protein
MYAYIASVGGRISESNDNKTGLIFFLFIVPCLRGSFLRMSVRRAENTTYGIAAICELVIGTGT